MRKWFWIVTTFLLLVLLVLVLTYQNPVISHLQLGDVNGDGVINEKDLTKVQNYLLETEKLSRWEKLRADMNQDGEITILDLLKLSKYIHINK